MKTELHALCANLGLATLNGMYQGLLVTALVAGLLRWFAVRTNAATRHAVWMVTLALVVLMIPMHCLLDSFLRTSPMAHTMVLSGGAKEVAAEEPTAYSAQAGPGWVSTGSAVTESDFTIPGLELITDGPNPLGPLDQDSAAPARPAGSRQPLDQSASAGMEILTQTQESEREQGDAAKTFPVRGEDSLAATLLRFLRPGLWDFRSTPAVPVVMALLAVWIVGTSIQIGLLVHRLRHLRRLTIGSSRPDQVLQSLFADLVSAAGVSRKVELRISEGQRCPVVLGFVHPIILLPAALSAHMEEARQVLAHELAHVRRYDDWVNLAQHVAQALLFFHPAVWWIGKRLCLEREIACDDYVLLHGTPRRNYALTLTNVAGRIRQQPPILAPGVSNSRSQLQQRISMILNTRRNSSPCLAKGSLTSVIAFAALIAVLALYSAPRLVFAGAPPPQSPSAPAVNSAAVSTEPGPAVAPATPEGAGAVVAESAPPGDAPPGIEPGAKFKPEDSVAEPPAPDAPPAPSADFAWPGKGPRAARGKVGKIPRAPEPPDAAVQADGSIEERLNRLEKMVRSLMDQQKRSRGMFYSKDGADVAERDQQQLEKLRERAEAGGDKLSEQKFKDMEQRFKEMAERQAEQADRVAAQAKRATRDLEARLEQGQQGRGELREGLQQQLESLRKAREGLGQEMERLNKQIQKIEREQQRVDREKQRRSEAPREKLQAENETAPEPAP